MKRFAMLLAAIPLLPPTAPAHADDDDTICDTGPITRIYGNESWLVYGCRDGQSVLFVSTPSGGTNQVFFALVRCNGAYKLHSESAETEARFAAAYEQMKSLTPEDIAELIAAAESQQRSGKADQP
jgi:hypothetical protein